MLCRRIFARVLAPLLWICGSGAAWPAEDPAAGPALPQVEVKAGVVAAEIVQPAIPDAAAVAWLGIVMEVTRNLDLEEDEKPLPGVGVMDAVEGGPAKKAGLRQFDRVLKLDGKALKDAEDLRTTVRANKPGKEVKLRILRDGKELEVKVTLEQMPPQQNLLIFQGAANPQLKPDKVQFYNRPPRAVETSGPDAVMLADGNRLEGQVQSVSGTELAFKLKSGSEATLLLAELASVRLAGESKAVKLPVAVFLRDGGWLAAARISLKERKVSLTLEDGGKVEIDRGQVAEVAMSNDDAPGPSGDLAAGGVTVTGTMKDGSTFITSL